MWVLVPFKKKMFLFSVELQGAKRKKISTHKAKIAVSCQNMIQWNLVIKRSDITKLSYNKVILLVPALYIFVFFYPDIMRNLIKQGNFHGPKDLVITRFHCIL